MSTSGTFPMTRRGFIAAAGLNVAAATVGAADSPAEPDDLPKFALLSNGEAGLNITPLPRAARTVKRYLYWTRF